MGILKNEKYVGDLLQGKTFTVDPITHRRLENLGEVNQYLVRDHHTAIISRGTFDKVQEIIKKRAATHGNVLLDKDNRTITRRKYAFSSKIRCGYCGAYLSRRVWNEGNNGTKVVWECVESTKNGKEHCPYSKALPEEAIEGSFIESLRLMTQEHANILLDFVNSVDAELDLHSASRSLNHEKKILKDLNNKLSTLIDLKLEGKIPVELYEQKRLELEKQIERKKTTISDLENSGATKQIIHNKMENMRELLGRNESTKEFDRQVFESIVDYIIVGGYDDNGNCDPAMITFIYRTSHKDSNVITLSDPEKYHSIWSASAAQKDDRAHPNFRLSPLLQDDPNAFSPLQESEA